MAKKLTLNEIIERLKLISPDIEIVDNEYKGSKIPIKCKCKTCHHEWSAKWNNLSANKSGCPKCYQNSKPLNDKEVADRVNKLGYSVGKIKRTGVNNQVWVQVYCQKGHERGVGLSRLRGSTECPTCNTEKSISEDEDSMMTEVASMGYRILPTYTENILRDSLRLICNKGHRRESSYKHLKKSPKCRECVSGRPVKYDGMSISSELSNMNLKYIGGFQNVKEPISFICSCGNKAKGRLQDIRNGQRCKECAGLYDFDLDKLNQLFNSHGCELIDKDSSMLATRSLKFICHCGRSAERNVYHFMKFPRCNGCWSDSTKGENNYNWNPNLTEEDRLEGRKYSGYQEWRRNVFEKDSYTCQICGDNKGGNLNAHHLDGHDWAIDKRLYSDNGVTLCEVCHVDFHHIYGFGNNTKEQFKEYTHDLLEYNKELQTT